MEGSRTDIKLPGSMSKKSIVGRSILRNQIPSPTRKASIVLSKSKDVKNDLISPYDLLKKNRSYKKVFPNRVYTQWYRRYGKVLPDDLKIDYQPMQEVQTVDEDIALQYFYGEDGHTSTDMSVYPANPQEHRRKALERYHKLKEQEEKERKAALEEIEMNGVSRFDSMMRAVKTREGTEFGVSVREKNIYSPILGFLKKMQTKKRRRLHYAVLKPNSKWKVLATQSARRRINIMFRLLQAESAQNHFRRIIQLVTCAMRFINVVRIISGSTKQILKELETFKIIQRDTSYKVSPCAKKKMFDYTKYTFKDLHIPLETHLTLTKPWFTRLEKEIDTVVEVLQSYKSFVQYPPIFQRRLARLAWYIEIEENKYIIRERHMACDFYVLLKGKAMEVRLVGDPYYQGNGIMKLIRYIRKSEAFGDESMSDPECEREYSIISCEPCSLLAISVYDYTTMLNTKKDTESAPEHIIFISHLKLFEEFPKKKLMEEGDENITIHYFRPESVMTRSLKTCKYVFVIINGSCRVISEIVPEKRSPKEKIIIKSNKKPKPKHIKVEHKTKPNPPLFGLLEGLNNENWVPSKLDVNLVRQELSSHRRRHDSMIDIHTHAIDAEMAELQSKANDVLRTLPKAVRNTFSLQAFIKMIKRTEHVHSNKTKSISLKKAVISSTSFRSLMESINMEQWMTYFDSDVSPKNEMVSIPITENDEKIICLSDTDLSSDCTSSEQGSDVYELGEALIVSPNEVKVRSPRTNPMTKNSREKVTISTVGTTLLEMKENKKNTLNNISEQSSEDTITHVSSKLQTALKTRKLSIRDESKFFSRWKHVRCLSRGDYVGHEWLNFRNGPYEEPKETWSMVSNGCEVVMIKKSFLLKYLQKPV